jgi:hypothetical protein
MAGAVSYYEEGSPTARSAPGEERIHLHRGDVALYGLSLGADPSAGHVAIVTDDRPYQSPRTW